MHCKGNYLSSKEAAYKMAKDLHQLILHLVEGQYLEYTKNSQLLDSSCCEGSTFTARNAQLSVNGKSEMGQNSCSFPQGLYDRNLLLSLLLPLQDVKEHSYIIETQGDKSIVLVFGKCRPEDQDSKLILVYVTKSKPVWHAFVLISKTKD